MAATVNEKTNETKPNPLTTIMDEDQNTILHYSAARGKDDDFTKDLVKNETIDMKNYLGWTPLMMACKNGHVSTVNLLIELGADATKFNNYGMSVFLISVAGGNLEIVKLILNHLLTGGVSKRILQRTLSPISVSILFRQDVIMQYLIEKCFDLNAATPFTNITPLMFAAAMEDNESFFMLKKLKADAAIKNHIEETANDIKKSRNTHVQETKKSMTPAEMISRSPHMFPSYIYSPRPQILNVNSPFLCINSPSNFCSTPALLVMTPNAVGMQQVFFPPEFSPSHFVAVNPMPNF